MFNEQYCITTNGNMNDPGDLKTALIYFLKIYK